MQQTPLNVVTAAPRPIMHNGTEYLISPLTDADWGELTAWLQTQYLDSIDRHLSRLPTEAERSAMRMESIRTAARITPSNEVGLSILQSISGMARALWLSLRKRQPSLTYPMIVELMADPSFRVAFTEAFGAAQGVGDDAKGSNGAADPK